MAILTVIGVGSRLRGDDAIGPLLIDALSRQTHSQIELVDAGSDALGILEYLEGREHVVVIDACQMGREAGSVVEFDAAEIDFVLKDDPISLHGLGLAESIKMAASLNMIPEDLKIIGIEPESIQFNGSLSIPVQRALKMAVDIVEDKLNRVSQLAEA
ncbi:MAG: hydrogenase maturation protease [Candidatus Marinimicrobia bacterium]|jgi:hydrogenase maturation protease|nr:hydrogenase maturation protease [Candidatus Neomarinimicrobiota bacterium]MBT3575593.1 hydrogenase maturation protease [Candidatus Neomarinimicrobiota bacterium]MBT3681246.1 hydrogenase maturation protease [Candidatus Neomarinimicrobiota bacterium]MBT3950647.1 hydrogenase maturation protease [Candidatus Neomarinimicrobiota bacterium]MBT4253366.1 hydrogenase maturation protease [Candidatus Neomarinimicrobiota bacterium]